jgi:hypothetical protein
MKTMAAAFGFLWFLFASAVAQPGPGPPPSPWIQSGSAVYYNGCVTVPQTVSGGCRGNGTIAATQFFAAPATTAGAGLNVIPGVAPSSPINGAIWTTSSGIFVRINGATVQLLGSLVTTALTIDLGSGTNIPAGDTGTALQVLGADATVVRVEATAFGAAAVVSTRSSLGTRVSPTTLTIGTLFSSYNMHGYDGSVWTSAAYGAIHTYAEATWTSTSHPTEICIATTPTTASAPNADFLCQHDDGGITIGSPTGADKGAGTLNIAGSIYNNGTAPTGSGGGYVLATGPTMSAPTITGSPTFSGSNFLTLANIVQDPTGFSLLGNTAAGASNYAPFTVGGLTNKSSPAGSDILLLQDQAASGALKYCTLTQCISALASGVSAIDSKTGAFTTGNGLDTATNLIELTAARRTLPTISIATSSAHSGGFSANGTGTYTAPANVLWYELYMVAGGGAGSSGGSTGSGGGGGGGSGSLCYSVVTTNIGTGQAYTAGANGANSTFGTSFSLTTNFGGGGAPPSSTVGGAGGNGGAAGSGCSLNLSGGAGAAAGNGTTAINSGPGGSGGASFYGSGGAGSSTTGNVGTVPGSGGGGGGSSTGAIGAAGQIFVIEHYGT